MSKKTVFVEIEEPPEGYEPQTVGCLSVSPISQYVLPVIAVHRSLPAAISPEARAVLDAAVTWQTDVTIPYDDLWAAAKAYRAALAPPDPLDEVRAHLRDIAACAPNHSPMMGWAHAAIAALDRAQKKGETA